MKMNARSLGLYLGLAVGALSLGVALFHVSSSQTDQDQAWQSQLSASFLPEGRAIQDFTLTDHNGRPFTKENLQGKWSFVFFGFTHCQKMCLQPWHS